MLAAKITRLRSWLRSVLRRAQFEQDLHDEMQLHIALRADDIERGGVPRPEAERRARVEFGGTEVYKQEVRQSRGLSQIDGLGHDIRYVARSLRRNLPLSLSVVTTLALAIGLTTGVFTMLDAVALRPRVDHDRSSFFRVHVAYRTDANRFPQPGTVSLADFRAFQAAATSARAMTAYVRLAAPLDGAELVSTRFLAATCDFFSVYVPPRPILGRPLQPADCQGAERVIVLSESAWRERYAADPGIIGRPVRLNNRSLTVIGVLPLYAGQFDGIQAWVPYTITPALGLGLDFASDPTIVALTVDGFAAPGRTRRNVATEIATTAARQDHLYPKRESRVLVTNGSLIEAPGSRALVTAGFSVVVLLLGFVVVIACTNVATLLLSRAEARRQEVAVRLAIGASRARLLRLLLAETAMLATLAGAASVWFAYATPPVLVRMLSTRPLAWSLDPDWIAFAWLAVATLLAGVAAGLRPALAALNMSLVDALKAGGAQVTSNMRRGRRQGPLYGRLISAQLAFSFVLLAGAYLFFRSYQRLSTVDVGHATHDVVSVSLSDRDPSAPAVGGALSTTVRSRLLAVPGVQRVAFASALPSMAPPPIRDFVVDGVRQPATEIEASGGFFETLGIAIVQGRALGDDEPACTSGGCAVVLSREMARQLFGARNALGATVRTDSGTVMNVVGVAGDVSSATGMPGQPLPIIYEPWRPRPNRAGYIAFVRATGAQGVVTAAISSAMRRALPDATVAVQSVQAVLDQSTQFVQQLATIIGAFAVLAVALAMIGIHGVVAFSVRRRSRELGVRIALGATPRDIYLVVARTYARPIAAGLIGGMLIAVPTAIFVHQAFARLPILDSRSPGSFVIAAVSMLAVIVVAVARPAWRAGITSPLAALRSD